MNYLIKFDENGRRTETYVKEEKTEAQINKLLANGFLAISETEYQLLIGNIDGQEYIRKSDGTFTPYVPPEPTEEDLVAQIRTERDRRLAETDWCMMPDYPSDPDNTEEMKAYRQALRDITEQTGFPKDVIWPNLPKLLCKGSDGHLGLAKVGI